MEKKRKRNLIITFFLYTVPVVSSFRIVKRILHITFDVFKKFLIMSKVHKNKKEHLKIVIKRKTFIQQKR